MSIYDRINKKLTQKLSILKLEVEDESAKHMGHAGYIEGGETHFKITVISDDFKGKSKVMRHKMIYKILQQELEERIHALSIVAITAKEIGKSSQKNIL